MLCAAFCVLCVCVRVSVCVNKGKFRVQPYTANAPARGRAIQSIPQDTFIKLSLSIPVSMVSKTIKRLTSLVIFDEFNPSMMRKGYFK